MFRKTPAALLATATLVVVASAGSATAGALITGQDVKNGSLTGKDVKASSLKAKHVKDSSLTGKDVKNGSLGAADLTGAVQTKLNAPAVAGYEVRSGSTLIESDGEGFAQVGCTGDKVAVGGGGYFADADVTTTSIEASRPMKMLAGDDQLFTDAEPGFANGWRVDGKHGGLDPQNLTAYVICIDPS